MDNKSSIYYDATFQIVAPHRGMATYLNGFLKALSSSGVSIKGLAPSGLSDGTRNNVILYGFHNILLWEQFSVPNFIKKNKVKCFIFPYNTGPVFTRLNCQSVLILHDLIFMEPFSKIPLSNSFKQIIGRFYRRATGPRMIKNADFIITVSEYSKKEIIKQYYVKEEKITVIPNCIDAVDGVQIKDETSRKYFLNVGGDAPHKNTAFLIRGYASLPLLVKTKYSLKIVGILNSSNKGLLNDLIISLKEEKNIFIEDFLEDDQLEKVYRGAFLFIFPSLTEGFGIPLLEAMKFGCSIVCSNTSSMPEVCGDAAFYFNPTDIQSFINAISTACNDRELRITKMNESARQLNYYSRGNFDRKVAEWFSENINKRSQ